MDETWYFDPPQTIPINAAIAHAIIPCVGDALQKKGKENATGNKSKNIFIPAIISFKNMENEYLSIYRFSTSGHNSSFFIKSSLLDIFAVIPMN
jgi:hypothetical protein